MNIRFLGTHFVDENAFRQIVRTENQVINQYIPDSGASELMNDYIGFGPKANWLSVGQLDNVWMVDSGVGETDQDRDFTQALQAYADRNGLNGDDFHRFTPKRFSGSNNAVTPTGEVDEGTAWRMEGGRLVPSQPTSGEGNAFMSLDEVADMMRPLYNPKSGRGYTGSVWAIVEPLRKKLEAPQPDADA
jgi:hypothetical protein